MIPIRVLIVAPWAERAGGAEEMLFTILRNLDRKAIEPEVGFLSSGPFIDEIRRLGISVWSMPSSRLRDPMASGRTVRGLSRMLRRGRYDVALAWSAKVHLYLGLAALMARRNVSIAWWQHSIPTGQWMDRLATLIPADAIGCSSRAGEQAQSRLFPRRTTFVVYPGVELTAEGQRLTRERVGVDDNAWVVGSVGRLQRWKGQDKVIRAVAELRGAGIDAEALIVGGTAFGFAVAYERELHDLSESLGIAGSVTFTGEVADATPYYPLMDVAVNASTAEPFGIAVVEAMAAGRPVVAFSGGGPDEIIKDGESGILVAENQLVGALTRLYADPERLAALGHAARKRARRFDAASSSARFVVEMERLVLSRAREVI